MTEAVERLTPPQRDLLQRYADAVSQAHSSVGLTSAKGRQEFFDRHVVDGVEIDFLIPSLYNGECHRLMDVGTGNGVPGLVLAILHPEWQVTLLDSDTKKCLFLDTFCNSSALKNVTVVVDRAESQAQGPLRETFDLVVARAVAPIRVGLELMAGFARVGGSIIVSRGTKDPQEADKGLLDILSLAAPVNLVYQVGEIPLRLEAYAKTAPLQPRFPRRVGIPNKRPL